MYTSKQCLEKLESCSNHEVLVWRFEYDKAIKREQEAETRQNDYSDLIKALTSNSYARSNQPAEPKRVKAIDEMVEDESIELELSEDEVVEVVATRRGRKRKGSK